MHKSIGTDMLAFVVGYKVMDMRAYSKDFQWKDPEVEAVETKCENDKGVCQVERFSDSFDHVSCVRQSVDDEVENQYDFSDSLVTNLVGKDDEVERESELHDSGHSTQRRFDDETMHSFQINNNENVIIESDGSFFDSGRDSFNSKNDMVHFHGEEVVLQSNNTSQNSNLVNSFRISSAPETARMVASTSLGEDKKQRNGSPDRINTNDSDRKRIRKNFQSKIYKVVLSYAAKIPNQAITNAIWGEDNQNTQEALRVLDIILRQQAANQGCLLVHLSFFHNNPKNFASVGVGVLGCRGYHSSFRGTQAGLSLNIDVSTTMILQPGPVVDFLIANQNVRDPFSIDWAKAKRMLKNMRMKTVTSNQEHKITGLSDRPCNQ